MRTTILLEEKDQGIFHLIQIKQPRPQTSNQFYADTGEYGYLFDCSNAKSVISQQTYNFPSSSIAKLNFRAFLNAGWNDIISMPGNFYTIGLQDGHLVAETNSPSLRCQELKFNISGDLIMTETTPLDFILKSNLTWSDLTSYAPSVTLSSSTEQYVTGVFLNLTTYNYTICQQPQVLLLDNQIKESLICLVIDDTQSNYQHYLRAETNIGSSFQYNMWPYSTCSDRSTIPSTTYTHLEYYLNGTIYDPGYLIHRKKYSESDSTIKFAYKRNQDSVSYDDSIDLKLTRDKQPWRLLGQSLTFSMQVGNDSNVQMWDQQLLLMENCQPDKLRWAFPPVITSSDVLEYPIYYTYFYSEGQVILPFPKPVITNENIDYYPENEFKILLPFVYSVFLNDSSIPSQFFRISQDDQTITIVAEVGAIKTVKIDLKAKYQNPYYYIDPDTKAITQSQLEIVIGGFAIIKFTVNTAPYFDPPLQDMSFQLPLNNLLVSLPDIIDDDSDVAKILSYEVDTYRCEQFVSVIISKSKQSNMLLVNPGISIEKNINCTVSLTLIDVMKNPRSSTTSFKITFLVPKVKNQTVEQEKKNDKSIELEVNLQQKDSPMFQIQKVDSVGQLSFQFNIPMKRTINPNFNLNSIIRKLQTTSNNLDLNQKLVIDYVHYFIQITHTQYDMYSGQESKLPDPEFYVQSFDGITLNFNLKFLNMQLLSKSMLQKKDLITVVMNNTQILISESGLVPIDQSWTLSFILPLQNGNNTQEKQAKELAEIAKKFMTGIMTSNFVLNILIAQSMQKLWSQLNILKLIVHTPLLQIVLPPNTETLFGVLISVCSFDFIQSEAITDGIFGRENFSELSLEPFNERLSILSYGVSNFIYNTGTIFYIYTIVIVVTVIAAIFTLWFKCLPRFFQLKVLKKIVDYSWRKLTPGLYLRLFIESNFELIIISYIQLNVKDSAESTIDKFSVFLAGFSAFLCGMIPIFSAVKIFSLHRQNQLNDKRALYWYGELYEQFLHPSVTRLSQSFFNVVQMMRQNFTWLCIFFFDQSPSIQLGLMINILVIVEGTNLHNNPYLNPVINRLNFLNEMVYFTVLAFSHAFTNFNPEEDSKMQIGILVNTLVIFMIGVNVAVIVFDSLYVFCRSVQKWLRFRRAKINQKKNNQVKIIKSQNRAYIVHEDQKAPEQKTIYQEQILIQVKPLTRSEQEQLCSLVKPLTKSEQEILQNTKFKLKKSLGYKRRLFITQSNFLSLQEVQKDKAQNALELESIKEDGEENDNNFEIKIISADQQSFFPAVHGRKIILLQSNREEQLELFSFRAAENQNSQLKIESSSQKNGQD